MKKVLVTGAGGYIGNVLTKLLLQNNYKVVALDRYLFGDTLDEHKHLDIVKGDIRTIGKEVFNGVDVIIDLAALSNDPAGELNYATTWSINHLGRFRVASLAKNYGVKRYILPSSCSVYGINENIVNEESPTNPLTTYAEANLQAEKDILKLADDDFCVTVIRQATVFGPSKRMRFDLAINGMTKGFYQNGKIPILRDGKQWRPFIHVKDTSKAMMMIIEADKELINKEIFNVGSNKLNYQIFDLANSVAKGMNIPFKYEWYGEPDHRSYRIDFSKIENKLGFNADYSAREGARQVYQSIKNKEIDPEDIKTITVKWYKKLIEDGVKL